MNRFQHQDAVIKDAQAKRRAEVDRSRRLVEDSATLLDDAVDRCRRAFPDRCERGEPHHYLVLGAIALIKAERVGGPKVSAAAVLAWADDHNRKMTRRGYGDPDWPHKEEQ